MTSKKTRHNPKRPPKDYYSTIDLMKRWDVSRVTIEKMSDEALPRFRPGAGKLIRFARKDVETYEKNHGTPKRTLRRKKRSAR